MGARAGRCGRPGGWGGVAGPLGGPRGRSDGQVHADAQLERHLADHLVRLGFGFRVIVERLPLHESRQVREEMADGDAVEMRAAEVR